MKTEFPNCHILFVRTQKQMDFCRMLEEFFPKEHGQVFLPKYEKYRSDRKEVEIRILFPAYIFVRTDMDRLELRKFLTTYRGNPISFFKTLGDDDVSSLTDEEKEFFRLLLDGDGIARMSYGYIKEGRAVVVDGPLKHFTNRIAKVDRHSRLAMMPVAFREHDIIVGLTIRPKRELCPDDEDAPYVLRDGSEVDLNILKKKMMG